MTLPYIVALLMIFAIVLISMQYTLNRILLTLKETNTLLNLLITRK